MVGVVNKFDLVDIREAINEDRAFIFSTWLKGLRHGNDYFGLIDSESYYKHYHKIIEDILDDFEVSVKVACLREDPSVILGYCVHKDSRLDYVFIKKSWRKIGLAKDLVPQDIKVVSHMTKVGLSLLKKRPEIVFNPFL